MKKEEVKTECKRIKEEKESLKNLFVQNMFSSKICYIHWLKLEGQRKTIWKFFWHSQEIINQHPIFKILRTNSHVCHIYEKGIDQEKKVYWCTHHPIKSQMQHHYSKDSTTKCKWSRTCQFYNYNNNVECWKSAHGFRSEHQAHKNLSYQENWWPWNYINKNDATIGWQVHKAPI